MSVLCSCFVMQYLVSILVLQSLAEEDRHGCLTLIVLLMSCACYCCVSLPYCAVGLSAVSDCVISWSYSLLVEEEFSSA